MAVAVKLVYHRPAGVVAVVVHAAQVHQVVEAQFLSGEGTDGVDLPGLEHSQRDFAAEFGGFRQQIVKLCLQFLSEFQ